MPEEIIAERIEKEIKSRPNTFLAAAGTFFAASLMVALAIGRRKAVREATKLGETIGQDPVNMAMKAFGYGTLFCLTGLGTAGGGMAWYYQRQGIASMPEFSAHVSSRVQRMFGSVEENASKDPVTEEEKVIVKKWQALESEAVEENRNNSG